MNRGHNIITKMYSSEPTAAFKPNEVGIFTDVPMLAYRFAPGISGSDLKVIEESPAKYLRGERPEQTEAMKFGTLANDILLFGTKNWHVQPDIYQAPESAKKDAPIIDKPWNWNAGLCQKWREEHSDMPILKRTGRHSSRWLEAIKEKIAANAQASALISGSMHEVSIFSRSDDYPILKKGRLDGLILESGGACIVEIKTTLDASTPAFSREILKRGYHRKAAYYRTLLHDLGVSPVDFWFIAIQKGENPRVNVRRLEARAMDKGDFDNDDALSLLMKCKLGNFWPDFPDDPFPGDGPQIPLIDLPDFAYGASVDELKGMTDIITDEEEPKHE